MLNKAKFSLTNALTAVISIFLQSIFVKNVAARNLKMLFLDGAGSVATYTIITVPPAGFEKYTPYAFVVLQLNDSDLRISGFMAGIATPADLPVGTPAKITGFDERGIIVEKQ